MPDDNAFPSRHDHLFTGAHFAVSPDLRIWLPGHTVAFELAPELLVAGGKDHSGVRGSYLRDTGGFAELGLWARVVVAL